MVSGKIRCGGAGLRARLPTLAKETGLQILPTPPSAPQEAWRPAGSRPHARFTTGLRPGRSMVVNFNVSNLTGIFMILGEPQAHDYWFPVSRFWFLEKNYFVVRSS